MNQEEKKFPLPPFTLETAKQKIQGAEDAWNSKNPAKVAKAYSIDSEWRNRSQFINGRTEIQAFLADKWENELNYRLKKEYWAHSDYRIAVRFEYEYQTKEGQWYRAYGNENWEFDDNGLMKKRFASINDLAIAEADRRVKLSLKDLLAVRRTTFAAKASDAIKQLYQEGIQAVVDDKITEQAKQVGEFAPNFKLQNALNETVNLKDYLNKGAVILTWYRGGWCPYCNITLRKLQKELPKFKALDATLLALTPELPDKSLSTAEKNALDFEVLSDVGNQVAKAFGIVFELIPEVAKKYQAGFDMHSYNGDTSNELPLAATYVINQEGKIIYAFLDADYRNRAEPLEIMAALR